MGASGRPHQPMSEIPSAMGRCQCGRAHDTLDRRQGESAMTDETPARPRLFIDWRDRHRETGLGVILGLLAVIMFVVSPLAGSGRLTTEAIEALRFAMAATAILIVSRSRTLNIAVAATFVVSLAGTLLIPGGGAGHVVYLVNLGITIAFDLAVTWTVARAAFDAGRITTYRIMGAVILYLYIGLIFASIYRVTAAILHPSFGGLPSPGRRNLAELLYFSLSCLTTSGFGDIAPVHPFIRSLANLESVIGQLYPAIFLGRLVTLHGAVIGPGAQKD
jgi:hypothetical protein